MGAADVSGPRSFKNGTEIVAPPLQTCCNSYITTQNGTIQNKRYSIKTCIAPSTFVICPYKLRSAIHVRNPSLQTCETPSAFVICPRKLHNAIHIHNLSVRTCIAPSTFVICLCRNSWPQIFRQNVSASFFSPYRTTRLDKRLQSLL